MCVWFQVNSEYNESSFIATGEICMRRLLLLLLLLITVIFFVYFQADVQTSMNNVQNVQPADQPVPRSDQNSMIAHRELLEKAKKGRIDIYFEGDSITRRWGTSDELYKQFLENWRQNFFGWNAA